ncbi:hypothetical protein DS2_00315 [Catenovulum agarivorans DS-2]|uniref:SPOR domain-containing protein n=2 Tax=Catenovulum agarivorans TaxID=1172192 RepID=W7R3B1_9ALTE|nr:hypothetical protein DS2_00315 [Catenovulum agarivorans DS-2]
MASLTTIPTLAVCADEINLTAAYIQARTDKPSAGALVGVSYESKSWGGVYLDYLNIDNIEFIDDNDVEQKNSLPAYLVGYQYRVPLNQKLSVAFRLGAAIANQQISDSQQTWLEPGDTALTYAVQMNWAVSDVLSLNMGLNRIDGLNYFGDISNLQLGLTYRLSFADKSNKVVRGEISKPKPLVSNKTAPATNRQAQQADKITINSVQASDPVQPVVAPTTSSTLVEQRMAERAAQGVAEQEPKVLSKKIETNVQQRPSQNNFKLQLGAFANPSNAKQLASKLESAGYQAEVVKKDNLNIVYAVGFNDRNQATSARKAISSRFAIDGIIRAN